MKNDNENIISLTKSVGNSIFLDFWCDAYDSECCEKLEVMVILFGLAMFLLVKSIMVITLWYRSSL